MVICVPLKKIFLAPVPFTLRVGLLAVFALANLIITLKPVSNARVPFSIEAVLAEVPAAVVQAP